MRMCLCSSVSPEVRPFSGDDIMWLLAEVRLHSFTGKDALVDVCQQHVVV